MPKKPTSTKVGAVTTASTKTKPPVRKPASVKPAATKPEVKEAPVKETTIIAKIDVGWGNSVYLRGQGDGLSWDVGVRMDCAKDDEWTWSCPASAGDVTFKFVRNDLHWELGEDHTVAAGTAIRVTPDFPAWD